MKVGNGYKYNNLYPLMMINPEGAVNLAKSWNSNLWHNRLGHISQDGLDRLTMIGYIPKLQAMTEFCEHCRYGKQTQSPHSLHYETVHQPLELVHIDICGPKPERSLGGSRYFITFVDESTLKVWAYSLRSKAKALTVFSQWLAEARTEQDIE